MARYVHAQIPGATLFESKQLWGHDFMFVELDKLLRILLNDGVPLFSHPVDLHLLLLLPLFLFLLLPLPLLLIVFFSFVLYKCIQPAEREREREREMVYWRWLLLLDAITLTWGTFCECTARQIVYIIQNLEQESVVIL